jgi:hypothetical protein
MVMKSFILKFIMFFLCAFYVTNAHSGTGPYPFLLVTEADVTGIYRSIGILEATAETSSYVTIQRNGDQYVLINISRHLGFLYETALITRDEALSPSITPPIEEFALAFTSLQEPPESPTYELTPVVSSPRTTELEWNRRGWATRWTQFTQKSPDAAILLHITTSFPIGRGFYREYVKIF